MINKDIERRKERLLELYKKDIITYEELVRYLEELEDEPELKEPTMIY